MANLVEFFPSAVNVVPEYANGLLFHEIDAELLEVVSEWNGSTNEAACVWFLAASYFLNRIVMNEDEAQDFAEDLRVATKSRQKLLSLALAAYVHIYNRRPAHTS